MDQLAEDFKDVLFYTLYTREPHAGQKMGQRMKNPKSIEMTGTRPGKNSRNWDFSDKEQTKTHQERVDYALEMIKENSQKRPILIDTFGPDCVQRTVGGGRPNSLVIIDKNGKIALWQNWSNLEKARKKLEEMTGNKVLEN